MPIEPVRPSTNTVPRTSGAKHLLLRPVISLDSAIAGEFSSGFLRVCNTTHRESHRGPSASQDCPMTSGMPVSEASAFVSTQPGASAIPLMRWRCCAPGSPGSRPVRPSPAPSAARSAGASPTGVSHFQTGRMVFGEQRQMVAEAAENLPETPGSTLECTECSCLAASGHDLRRPVGIAGRVECRVHGRTFQSGRSLPKITVPPASK